MIEQSQNALVLRKKQAAALIGVSIPTLDRLRVANSFPRPVLLGIQAVGFLRSDLEAWLEACPRLARYMETL